MTKYKEFMRAHGTKLACDFEHLPCKSLESIETRVMDDCVVAIAYFNNTTPQYAVYDRYGEHDWFDSNGNAAYVERFNYDSEYIDWLHAVGISNYAFVFTWMKRLYRGEHEVRIAFKHMKAGIMSEEVFCRWLAKRYKKILSFYGVC